MVPGLVISDVSNWLSPPPASKDKPTVERGRPPFAAPAGSDSKGVSHMLDGIAQASPPQVTSHYRNDPRMAGDGCTPEQALIPCRRHNDHAAAGGMIQSLF